MGDTRRVCALGLAMLLGLAPDLRASVTFSDVSEEAQVGFVHDALGYYDIAFNPFQNHLGPGAVWVDLNRDGWLDLVVGDGTELHPGNMAFLNNGDGTFSEVSEAMGVRTGNVSNGLIAADIDNNSFPDIIWANHFANPDITAGSQLKGETRTRGYGLDQLLFTRGEAPDGWDGPKSASLAMGDYDNDGFLDMYLVNQLTAPDLLVQNVGGRQFLPTTNIRAEVPGTGFQPVFFDYDQDGDQDIFVVNDVKEDYLYRNEGKESGWAFTEIGANVKIAGGDNFWANKTMGMGAAVGDFDNDLDLDVYVTNYRLNTLWQNPGDWSDPTRARFREVAKQKGVDYNKNTRGCDFADFDNDGDLDLYVVAGWVEGGIIPQPFDLPNQLYLNDGAPDYTFTEVGEEAGVADRQLGRSQAVGDYDRDGDLDIYITNNTYYDPSDQDPNVEPMAWGEHVLYRNDTQNDNNWLMLRLQGGGPHDDGTGCNRDAVGCRVYVTSSVGVQMRDVQAGSGYMGMNSIEVEFGLGQATAIDEVRVVWTCGREENFTGVDVNGYYRLVESRGVALPWPVALQRFEARSSTDGVLLEWWAAPILQVNSVRVHRYETGGADEYEHIEVDVTMNDGYGMGVDTTAQPGREYSYRVVLLCAEGNSSASSPALVTYEGGGATPLPLRPRLGQNFPNPFNPTTRILVELPREMDIELKLYDARGRAVRTLYRGLAPAGEFPVDWDGKDDRGREAAAGVYYYTLVTPEGTSSRRMAMVR